VHVDVVNPADGSIVGAVPYGGAAEARAACDAAAMAFPAWSNTPARARADLLARAAALLAERSSEVGLLLARETGKRLPEAVGEVRFAAEYFRWFAEQARRPAGEVIPPEASNRRHLTLARPSGVALALTPWNFPVSIQARKVAAALAAGCTVVGRPSEKAPLAVFEMYRCLAEAGLPDGVASVVVGPAAVMTEAMLAHPAVRVMSFTGSTVVGRQLMAMAARRIVRPLLELGGDAPFIVFADADLGRAIEGAMIAKFRNNGQSCIAANRFIIEAPVYDEFTQRLAARIDAMTIGDPIGDPVPDLGPLIDAERRQAVNASVEQALAGGAKRLTAPRAVDPGPTGAFIAPTLLSDVPDTVAISCDEVFGPVAGVFRFESEVEAVSRANATEMGLAAYLYTSSVDRSLRLSESIECGILGLNNPLPSVAFAPMGGIKQSGLGREGSHHGLAEFLDVRYMAVEIT
jgi:succinate-semialdehyde dehydrogenase/glutarate-semialdehyde dehydrogenase